MTIPTLAGQGDFGGRVALVTGGASGIGEAIARTLARRGASVVIADISQESGERVAEVIESAGGRVAFFEMDASIPSHNAAAVEFAKMTFGGLHHAVNNVGIASVGKNVGEMGIDEWRRVMDISLDGIFYGLRYEIPMIRDSGGGSIVNTSSISRVEGTYGNAAYVTAKHAIVGLTKSAAMEYAQDNIRINAIGPGYINTPAVQRNIPADRREALATMHAVKRLGTTQEVANLATFLLSDDASFITGSLQLVDGGFTAGYEGARGPVS